MFRALSDPTRRAVLTRLTGGTATVSELATPFDMALPSFLQHLRALEACGLVHSHKAGRIRSYRLAPKALREAEDWLSEQRACWAKRLDQLDAYLETMQAEPASAAPPSARKKEKKR